MDYFQYLVNKHTKTSNDELDLDDAKDFLFSDHIFYSYATELIPGNVHIIELLSEPDFVQWLNQHLTDEELNELLEPFLIRWFLPHTCHVLIQRVYYLFANKSQNPLFMKITLNHKTHNLAWCYNDEHTHALDFDTLQQLNEGKLDPSLFGTTYYAMPKTGFQFGGSYTKEERIRNTFEIQTEYIPERLQTVFEEQDIETMQNLQEHVPIPHMDLYYKAMWESKNTVRRNPANKYSWIKFARSNEIKSLAFAKAIRSTFTTDMSKDFLELFLPKQCYSDLFFHCEHCKTDMWDRLPLIWKCVADCEGKQCERIAMNPISFCSYHTEIYSNIRDMLPMSFTRMPDTTPAIGLSTLNIADLNHLPILYFTTSTESSKFNLLYIDDTNTEKINLIVKTKKPIQQYFYLLPNCYQVVQTTDDGGFLTREAAHDLMNHSVTIPNLQRHTAEERKLLFRLTMRMLQVKPFTLNVDAFINALPKNPSHCLEILVQWNTRIEVVHAGSSVPHFTLSLPPSIQEPTWQDVNIEMKYGSIFTIWRSYEEKKDIENLDTGNVKRVSNFFVGNKQSTIEIDNQIYSLKQLFHIDFRFRPSEHIMPKKCDNLEDRLVQDFLHLALNPVVILDSLTGEIVTSCLTKTELREDSKIMIPRTSHGVFGTIPMVKWNELLFTLENFKQVIDQTHVFYELMETPYQIMTKEPYLDPATYRIYHLVSIEATSLQEAQSVVMHISKRAKH